MANASATGYVPGVCNINRAEIAQRRKTGYLGLGLYVVIAVALFALGANRWTRLVLFVPAFLGAIGFLQAKNKFCVGFASAGQQNATEGSDKAQAIADKAAVAKDKARARTMNLQAAGIALLAAAVLIVI